MPENGVSEADSFPHFSVHNPHSCREETLFSLMLNLSKMPGPDIEKPLGFGTNRPGKLFVIVLRKKTPSSLSIKFLPNSIGSHSLFSGKWKEDKIELSAVLVMNHYVTRLLIQKMFRQLKDIVKTECLAPPSSSYMNNGFRHLHFCNEK